MLTSDQLPAVEDDIYTNFKQARKMSCNGMDVNTLKDKCMRHLGRTIEKAMLTEVLNNAYLIYTSGMRGYQVIMKEEGDPLTYANIVALVKNRCLAA